MKLCRGRLIDHAHLRTADLEASRRFYRGCLAVLRIEMTMEGPDHFAFDEIWVDRATEAVSRIHLAFQAADRAMVDRFHAAALAAGGRDNGAPGERPYHPGYYVAFVLDPDGNNIESVHHGEGHRNVAAVEITPTGMP